MNTYSKLCTKALKIDLDQSCETGVIASDLDFLRAHLQDCQSCGDEQSALDAISGAVGSATVRPLNDLSRRKLIDGVLSIAQERSQTAAQLLARRVNGRLIKVFGAAAALIAAVCVGAFWIQDTSFKNPQNVKNIAIKSTTVNPWPGSRFALLTGDVLTGGYLARIGNMVNVGEAIQTNAGRAVIDLPGGIVLSLGEATEITLVQEKNAPAEIRFERGEMLVAVEPGHGEARLIVSTRQGRVEVVGTILAMSTLAQSVEVRVLRGAVELVELSGERRKLEHNMTSVLGDDASWSLSIADNQAAQKTISELVELGLVAQPTEAEIAIQTEAANDASLIKTQIATTATVKTNAPSLCKSRKRGNVSTNFKAIN